MIEASAHFSADGKHRYELRRKWNSKLPPFVVIGLNPSFADKHRLDPTTKGVMKRAAHTGYGEFIMLNVGAGINTEPKKWKAMADPIGPKNYKFMRAALREAVDRDGIVVAAWGVHAEQRMVERVLEICWDVGVTLWCFDVTKKGHPKHPLYVAHSQELVRWNG